MRRIIAALCVLFMTGANVALVSSPAAAGPSHLGPRVIFVNTAQRTVSLYTGGKFDHRWAYSSFKVQGNSSTAWPKKNYGLTFEDNQRPFGLPVGREFRLNANYHDRSLLRNWVSYNLASKLDGLHWTPHQVFTEVFINGDYRGSYLMLETIAISPNRVDIPRSSGQIGEFSASGPFTDRTGMRTDLKDPQIYDRGRYLMAKVNKFTWRLDNTNYWEGSIDLKSFLDYYLVREFTKDKDADFLFSNFYYTSDVWSPSSKLVMGPVWDFDRSAGNEAGLTTTSVASPKYWWLRGDGAHHPWDQRHWYVTLTKKGTFRSALCNRWQQVAGYFRYTGWGAVGAGYKAVSGQAVANDRNVWGSSNVERPPSRGSYSAEVSYLQRWYQQRYYWVRDHIC